MYTIYIYIYISKYIEIYNTPTASTLTQDELWKSLGCFNNVGNISQTNLFQHRCFTPHEVSVWHATRQGQAHVPGSGCQLGRVRFQPGKGVPHADHQCWETHPLDRSMMETGFGDNVMEVVFVHSLSADAKKMPTVGTIFAICF